MAKTIRTELRAVTPKQKPAEPYRYRAQEPYANEDLARKWLAAVAWLRRGKKSKWLLDNVEPGKWRDVFDDAGRERA